MKTLRPVLDANLHLLDRQVVDRAGRMVCKVDDLEFAPGSDGRPVVTTLLAGPAALGPRVGGALGRWMVALDRRLSRTDPPGAARIAIALVTDIGSDIELSAKADELQTSRADAWVERHVIAKLPGAHHAG